MREVREVTTAGLRPGDIVHWHGKATTVVEVADTSLPAAFGTGTAYDLTLVDVHGQQTLMRAAASYRWVCS